MKTNLICILFITFSFSLFAQNGLTIATWNIEHLGSSGRGFPELGENGLGPRTDDDYKKIAAFIKDTLSFEIVCVQEVASSKKKAKKSYSNELDKIVSYLGTNWRYYLANFEGGGKENDEMQNAFIYDQSKVDLKTVFELPVPDCYVGEKKAFDRKPLIGYFIPKDTDDGFVVVNLHLASKQEHYENHLAAMIIVEQNLSKSLKKNGIEKEKDIIILGDLNDNPYKYSFIMYEYLAEKGYVHMVDKTFGSTRMDTQLTSLIDHILISKEAKKHVAQAKASIYKPKDMSKEGLKAWRTVYSDHFPLYVEYK